MVDLGATSLTMQALGGDLSAAFAAMDYLPAMGAAAAAFGMVAGASLMTALARTADYAGDPKPGRQARRARTMAYVVGGAFALAQILPGSALTIVLALAAVPCALVGLVAFLQAVSGVKTAIRVRTA
jgi:hypothetical protein